MSQLQDVVGSDLRRLMSDEPQDNIDEIRRMVKEHLVTDSINGIPLSPKDRRGDLFSNDMNKKISKVRPKYAARLVGLVLCGVAFGGMAVISATIVDYPYNVVLVLVALAPPAMAVVGRLRRGHRISDKRELL